MCNGKEAKETQEEKMYEPKKIEGKKENTETKWRGLEEETTYEEKRFKYIFNLYKHKLFLFWFI